MKLFKWKDYLSESKLSEFEIEMNDILNSSQLLEWLNILGGPPSEMTEDIFTGGYCEDLASYLYYKYKDYGAQLAIIDDKKIGNGHYFIKYGDKFYDAANRNGVDKVEDLKWSKWALSKRPNLTEKDLNDSLRYNWDGGYHMYQKAAKIMFNI